MSRPIALFGSSRRHGNTGQFMDRIAAEAGIEVVDLGTRNISPYDYEHRNRGDDFEPLMMRALEHDAIVFASPVYWYTVSPQLKVFLDRISDLLDLDDLLDHGRRLRGKTGYVVCTSIYDEVPQAVRRLLCRIVRLSRHALRRHCARQLPGRLRTGPA